MISAGVAAGIVTGLFSGLFFPLLKDMSLEAWKRWTNRRIDDATVRVAEIEQAQGRELRVSADIWKLVDELKDQVEKLEERCGKAEERADQYAKEVEQLRDQLRSLRAVTAENTRLRNKIKTLQARVEHLQKELGERAESIS